jgi:hypothetical protein
LSAISANSQVFTCNSPNPPPDGVLVGLLKDNSGNQFIVIYNSADIDYNYEIGSGSWTLLTNINDTGITLPNGSSYPMPGTVFTAGQNVQNCGTSVTVLASTSNAN